MHDFSLCRQHTLPYHIQRKKTIPRCFLRLTICRDKGKPQNHCNDKKLWLSLMIRSILRNTVPFQRNRSEYLHERGILRHSNDFNILDLSTYRKIWVAWVIYEVTTMKSSFAPSTSTSIDDFSTEGTGSDELSFLRSNSGILELSFISAW